MRKRFLRTLALILVPFIGALLIRIIYFASKKHFHMPQVIPQEPVVFAFWHGDLLMQAYLYKQFRTVPKGKVLISDHFDGQIIAGVIRSFGIGALHGSTTRGGAKVLIQGLKSLSNGYDIGITPDGPKGPRFTVSEGVVVLAQKSQAKVIVFSCVPTSYWQLGSWDHFVIPKPFGALNFYASEAIDLEGVEMAEAKEYLYKALMLHTIV